MPQVELYELFKQVRGTGIFVCSSRYETLGIAPLEAALSGVTTLVTDTHFFEASRYFPPECRFEANAQALADRLTHFLQHPSHSLGHTGRDLHNYVRKTTKSSQFEEDIVRIWSHISHKHMRPHDFSSSVTDSDFASSEFEA